ncbi:hypothetical protein BHE74_00034662 [Ensete ventricosum]|nr:hypothetical protein BHE74_00034662 [Ensete ventricosum]
MKPWSSAYRGCVPPRENSKCKYQRVPWGDLIIQRYDWSDWRVGLLQCSYSFKRARQVRGQGRVVERDEEVTTSSEGLSYPKAKRRLERKWTRRSATVP